MPSARIIYAGEVRAADDPFRPRALAADMSVWAARRDDLYPTIITPAVPRPSASSGQVRMADYFAVERWSPVA
jgi:hypothetical protein